MKQLNFAFNPESIAFTVTPEGEDQLIIGLRDTAYLIYFNCTTLVEERVSLNENDWDEHCSFTPLYLSVSPDHKLLLVASDKHLHYVYKIRTNQRIATLGGHTCSDYGRPRVAWDPSGKYIYSNSEADNAIHVYCLFAKKIIYSLRGHTGVVKDMSCNEARELVTGSFDKTVMLWTPESSSD